MSFSDVTAYASKTLLASCIINNAIIPPPLTHCWDCGLNCKTPSAFLNHLRSRHTRRIQCNSCNWQTVNPKNFSRGYDSSFNVAMAEHLKVCTQELSPKEPQMEEDVQVLYMLPSSLDENVGLSINPPPTSISASISLPDPDPVPVPLPSSMSTPTPIGISASSPPPLPLAQSSVALPIPTSVQMAPSALPTLAQASVEAPVASSSALSAAPPSSTVVKRNAIKNEFPTENRRKKLRSNKEY